MEENGVNYREKEEELRRVSEANERGTKSELNSQVRRMKTYIMSRVETVITARRVNSSRSGAVYREADLSKMAMEEAFAELESRLNTITDASRISIEDVAMAGIRKVEQLEKQEEDREQEEGYDTETYEQSKTNVRGTFRSTKGGIQDRTAEARKVDVRNNIQNEFDRAMQSIKRAIDGFINKIGAVSLNLGNREYQTLVGDVNSVLRKNAEMAIDLHCTSMNRMGRATLEQIEGIEKEVRRSEDILQGKLEAAKAAAEKNAQENPTQEEQEQTEPVVEEQAEATTRTAKKVEPLRPILDVDEIPEVEEVAPVEPEIPEIDPLAGDGIDWAEMSRKLSGEIVDYMRKQDAEAAREEEAPEEVVESFITEEPAYTAEQNIAEPEIDPLAGDGIDWDEMSRKLSDEIVDYMRKQDAEAAREETTAAEEIVEQVEEQSQAEPVVEEQADVAGQSVEEMETLGAVLDVDETPEVEEVAPVEPVIEEVPDIEIGTEPEIPEVDPLAGDGIDWDEMSRKLSDEIVDYMRKQDEEAAREEAAKAKTARAEASSQETRREVNRNAVEHPQVEPVTYEAPSDKGATLETPFEESTSKRKYIDYTAQKQNLQKTKQRSEDAMKYELGTQLRRIKSDLMSKVERVVTVRRNGLSQSRIGSEVAREARMTTDQIETAFRKLESSILGISSSARGTIADAAIMGVSKVQEQVEDSARLSDDEKRENITGSFRKTRNDVEDKTTESQGHQTKGKMEYTVNEAVQEVQRAINHFVQDVGYVNLALRQNEHHELLSEVQAILKNNVQNINGIHDASMKKMSQELITQMDDFEHEVKRSQNLVLETEQRPALFSATAVGKGTFEQQRDTAAKRAETESTRENMQNRTRNVLSADLII